MNVANIGSVISRLPGSLRIASGAEAEQRYYTSGPSV